MTVVISENLKFLFRVIANNIHTQLEQLMTNIDVTANAKFAQKNSARNIMINNVKNSYV